MLYTGGIGKTALALIVLNAWDTLNIVQPTDQQR